MASVADQPAAAVEGCDADEACSKMMEETCVLTDESYDYDSLDEHDRPAERWTPLGAAATTPSQAELNEVQEKQNLRKLEEEQEQLNSSLLALTTHFAQVQFRLKQIVTAPTEHKEELLKELEEFAFKGIPDVRGCKVQDAQIMEEASQNEVEAKINEQREKQHELIHQLKSQLEDLETYAYEMGEADLPTNRVMEKQKVIIDELTNKLDLDLDNFPKLSTEDLRLEVDKAIGQIVNPAKVKEKLVEQLKTQIVDLERFIDFLQDEAQTNAAGDCSCPVHGLNSPLKKSTGPRPDPRTGLNTHMDDAHKETLRDTTMSIMKQALTVLQIFAISQFGCGGTEFQKNLLKRTSKGNHWGDLRARLELTISKVTRLAREQEHNQPLESDYTSDSEDTPAIMCNQALTSAVRKDLAMALRDLLQHGLMEVGQSSSLVPFGCIPNRSVKKSAKMMMHAWDLFLKYYEMKHGREYTESPARKLSQSFSLEMVGGKAITIKQIVVVDHGANQPSPVETADGWFVTMTLLTAVEEVISSHVPLKRSEDSQFKAFVCIALNQQKLVPWLRVVLRVSSLIEYYYQPWSYVVRTGFDDALISLDKLSKMSFNLPVDLAVRPFKNIKDAF